MMRDAEKTLGNLIDHQSVAFLSSVDEAGYPAMRAMLPPRQRQGIREFWFTTNTSSIKVQNYRENPKACLYFCDRRFVRGVTLFGTVQVLQDNDAKQLIWQQGDEQHYPLGVTDPDYCVLLFTATHGRYYSSHKVEAFDTNFK